MHHLHRYNLQITIEHWIKRRRKQSEEEQKGENSKMMITT